MRHGKKQTEIDWEKRCFELASALFYQDLRHTAESASMTRLENWPFYIRVAAEMAVEAAGKFIDEYRRSFDRKEKGGQCHAP